MRDVRSSRQCRVTCRKVKSSRLRISELEYSLLGPVEMKTISIVFPSPRTGGTNGGCSRCVVLDTRRGKEVADAVRFSRGGTEGDTPNASNFEEERRTGGKTPLRRWKRREVLDVLETMERKQKLRIGDVKEQ